MRRDQKSAFGQHNDSYVIVIIVYNVVLGIMVISENICTTNAEMGDSCHPQPSDDVAFLPHPTQGAYIAQVELGLLLLNVELVFFFNDSLLV